MASTKLTFENPFAYVEFRSKTLHDDESAVNYRGEYQGINADVNTACYDRENSTVLISKKARLQSEATRLALHDGGKVVYVYRHEDIGEIRGTSENIFCVKAFPCTDVRGLNILQLEPSGNVNLNIWGNYLTVEKGAVYKINFLQSVILIKNYGVCDAIEVTDEPLPRGVLNLDTEKVRVELDMEPKGDGGITVKVATD